MRNFLLNKFIVLVLLTAFSCSKKVIPVGSEISFSENKYKKVIPADTTVIYKTAVDAYGHYLSGLLIIKSTGTDDYRLIFTTEMGIKLFDFEYIGDRFIVHQIIDKMNRKPVIRLLQKDFSLMLGRDLDNSRLQMNTEKEKEFGGETVYFMQKGEVQYYIYDRDSRQVKAIKSFSDKGKEKLFINFGRNGESVPATMSLEHQNLNLKIKLDLIKR